MVIQLKTSKSSAKNTNIKVTVVSCEDKICFTK